MSVLSDNGMTEGDRRIPLIRDVIKALSMAFPEHWQESYDNTGLQLGDGMRQCTGAMICVDATPEIVAEAYDRGCNLLITHHPLIFHPLKRIEGLGRVERTIYKAIKNDVVIYSCHTSVDNAPVEGVSWEMGRMLGLSAMQPLESNGEEGIGSGVIGSLPTPLLPSDLALLVKETFGSVVTRCSDPSCVGSPVSRVALCGGAGGFLIPKAIDAGAQAFITSDSRHNHFIDFLGRIFLIDIGHYESEKCTKHIFYQIIKEKFPNFAVYYSELEKNPINYL